MDLATHMGAQLPPNLKMSGTMDGAMVYSRGGHLEGELGFHDTAVTTPDSPPLRFEHAYLVLDQEHVRLSPAVVHTGDDQADVEADYAIDRNTLDLSIHSDAMKVASLRAQGALPALPWLDQAKSGQWSGDLHYRRETDKSAWTGRLQITDAELPVTGLADPVRFKSARLQLDGERVAVDQIVATAGKIAFRGEYRHDPALARPDRVRLRAEKVDAAELEAELLPSLRRDRSLLARALGRSSIPDWMKDRALEGTVQVDDLELEGAHLSNVRAGLRWDTARVEMDGLQAKLDKAAITGRLIIGLRGVQPTYRLTGKVKGLPWQSGKLDAEGTLETSGTGAGLLANLKSEAAFTGSALDFGAAPPWRTVSGSCNLAWSPRLRVTDLNLKTAEDETYTGKGSAQEDGRLVILLSNGAKEMRMTGTLSNLKVE
jgi:hypothetical protein